MSSTAFICYYIHRGDIHAQHTRNTDPEVPRAGQDMTFGKDYTHWSTHDFCAHIFFYHFWSRRSYCRNHQLNVQLLMTDKRWITSSSSCTLLADWHHVGSLQLRVSFGITVYLCNVASYIYFSVNYIQIYKWKISWWKAYETLHTTKPVFT